MANLAVFWRKEKTRFVEIIILGDLWLSLGDPICEPLTTQIGNGSNLTLPKPFLDIIYMLAQVSSASSGWLLEIAV